MHYFRNPRHTQSMIADMMLTEYFRKFQWEIALWDRCQHALLTCICHEGSPCLHWCWAITANTERTETFVLWYWNFWEIQVLVNFGSNTKALGSTCFGTEIIPKWYRRIKNQTFSNIYLVKTRYQCLVLSCYWQVTNVILTLELWCSRTALHVPDQDWP